MLLSITGRSSRNKRGMDTGDLEREREDGKVEGSREEKNVSWEKTTYPSHLTRFGKLNT